MRIINSHDWDSLSDEFQNAKPFPSICIDNFLEPSFAKLLSDSYPDFAVAQTLGQEFKTANEKKKVQITNPDLFPDPICSLVDALSGNNFLSALTTLSGINHLQWDPSLSGGGMHLTNSAGALDVHVDFNYSNELNLYRRLNILIYLNDTWEDAWGGNVELWDSKVKNCIKSFPPVLNRCVIFATSESSFHGVTAVNTPPGTSRNSFAAYYYSPESADRYDGLPPQSHGTIFKARPDEKLNKYWSIPFSKVKKSISARKKQIKSIIRNQKK